MPAFMVLNIILIDGKTSTDDIRQTLGGSGWYTRMNAVFDVIY